jgi:hypothetical protein
MIIIILLSILTLSFFIGFIFMAVYSLWINWIEFEIEIDLGDEDYIN